MHSLSRSQVRKAERLAEDHTSSDLGAMCMNAASVEESRMIGWAVHLRTEADRTARGVTTPTFGYTGRKSNST